jgi:hypothetical protein
MATSNLLIWLVLGIGAFLTVAALLVFLIWRRSRDVNLTETSPGETPEWMREQPPEETQAATQADGEGITVYDFDEGEKLAAPFAEQIEDIVHDQIAKRPSLAHYEVDFGTAPDGTLEIWVNGERYTDIADVPNVQLRETIRGAVQSWQGRA